MPRLLKRQLDEGADTKVVEQIGWVFQVTAVMGMRTSIGW